MSQAADTLAGAFPRVATLLRWVAAIVGTGVLGALFWLFLIQEGFQGRILKRTWTDMDFAAGLGHAAGAQEPARTGLYLSLAIGIVLALVLAAVMPRLPFSGWRRGIAFAAVPFVAWAALYCPLVNARRLITVEGDVRYLDNGVLGTAAGWGTLPSAIVASLATGLVMTHVLGIIRDRDWWEHDGARPAADDVLVEELLELTEERPQERVEGPR